jgi:GNAT superfamily N-acetyltransferase
MQTFETPLPRLNPKQSHNTTANHNFFCDPANQTVNQYSTWEGECTWLENLYVVDEERNKKIGTMLLAAVVKETVDRNLPRLDFAVRMSDVDTVRFYQRSGAVDITEQEDWQYYKYNIKQQE